MVVSAMYHVWLCFTYGRTCIEKYEPWSFFSGMISLTTLAEPGGRPELQHRVYSQSLTACIQRLKMIPSCLKTFAVKPAQTPSWASGLVGTWKEFDNFCAYFTGTLYCQYKILCVCATLVLFYICFTLYFQEWHDDKLRWEPSEYGGVEEIYVPRWIFYFEFSLCVLYLLHLLNHM